MEHMKGRLIAGLAEEVSGQEDKEEGVIVQWGCIDMPLEQDTALTPIMFLTSLVGNHSSICTLWFPLLNQCRR
eukprot:1138712-Pelagomonas_calceolata.AAC.2